MFTLRPTCMADKLNWGDVRKAIHDHWPTVNVEDAFDFITRGYRTPWAIVNYLRVTPNPPDILFQLKGDDPKWKKTKEGKFCHELWRLMPQWTTYELFEKGARKLYKDLTDSYLQDMSKILN